MAVLRSVFDVWDIFDAGFLISASLGTIFEQQKTESTIREVFERQK